ncbi:MAG TPA: ABC transporter permease [Acidimicrobiia bacterium]|nr:ABC transporter permease [Acidimicrobiia bacterium]
MTTAMEVDIARAQWRVVLGNVKVMAGLLILSFFLLALVAGPILEATLWEGHNNLYDPQTGYDRTIAHPSPPSGTHWLGTSSLGKDVFSMFLSATRPTLTVATLAGVTIGLISLVTGAVAAYRGGWVDGLVSHLSDAMVLLPAMLAVFILGVGRSNAEFGAWTVGLTFGVIYALGPATATVRAAALTVMVRPFVDAARVAGGGGWWMVTRHVLPHLVPHAAVQAMIGVTGAVVAEAFLSYFNAVGEDFGYGWMVYDGITWSNLLAGIADIPWWVMITGAGAITLVASAFYLLGVGLREAFDPKTHRPR